ncbi:MAG: class I SAM-dependent methyltransferase [Acidimicrobiia bacterium]
MAAMAMDEQRIANLANWEDRVPVHTGPDGYALEEFDDPAHLSRVVQFDVPRLGDIAGLDVVHLQCHIGTDTVSLGRLGARSVIGYDFSPRAVAAARGLADRADSTATFVEGELYDAVAVLGAGRFDLVFTGIGALVWLPDINGWAQVVTELLRPGGRLHLREGHPMLMTLDETRTDGIVAVRYPAFGSVGATRFDEATSYEGDGTPLAHTTTYQWNWSIGEIVTALVTAGLRLDGLTEHRTVPWNALDGLMREVPPLGEWELAEDPDRLAASYTLQASKPR